MPYITDLYLISTFRNEWNRIFNVRLEAALENAGLKGYFAHRDTNQKGLPADIYAQDTAGIRGSRVMLAVAENESPNWGVEVGYAFGLGKPVLALAQKNHVIPLIAKGMIQQTLFVDDLNALDSYLPALVEMLRRA